LNWLTATPSDKGKRRDRWRLEGWSRQDQDREEGDGCTGARMTKQEPLEPLKPFPL
jgi:hypothetical protein